MLFICWSDSYIFELELEINKFEKYGSNSELNEFELTVFDEDEDIENAISEDFQIGKKVKIDLQDMNTIGWKTDLQQDKNILQELLEMFFLLIQLHQLKQCYIFS